MSDFQLFDTTNSIEHELPEGNTVIGRGADCDIRVISSSVSRKHGQLELAGAVLVFSDLGSSNGSFVNGQPVTAAVPLQNGDQLRLGEIHFTVSSTAGAAPDAGLDEDATQMMGAAEPMSAPNTQADAIPSTWSESAGLEQASGTQFGYFSDAAENEGAAAYRAGSLQLPPIAGSPRLVGLNESIFAQVFELDGSADEKGQMRTWKLGREADSVDLVIDHVSVSGQHAQLINEGARWKIVNWMSTNGTFVNDQKGLSTYLQSGDVIRMGSAELAFELPPQAVTRNDQKSKAGSSFAAWLRRLFGKG